LQLNKKILPSIDQHLILFFVKRIWESIMMITRRDATLVQEYADCVKRKVYERPADEQTLIAVSKLLDESAKKAYQEAQKTLEKTREFKQAISVIKEQPRTCGGFKEENAILDTLTAYEQSAAVVSWVKEKSSSIKKPHTITLYSEEGPVPVWVKKPKNAFVSPMTVILGTPRGALKAPSYENWAEEDPKTSQAKLFVEPLNALEMHRQPDCLGALTLKASSYDAGVLKHDWRYKIWNSKQSQRAKEASVELKQQQTTPVKQIKAQSAGYNLALMIENNSIRKKNLLPEVHFEDYSDEGYNDYGAAFLSPENIVKTLPAAIKGNTDDLDSAMQKLFSLRIGQSSISPVKDLVINHLFTEED
jgi:hypothetical protein